MQFFKRFGAHTPCNWFVIVSRCNFHQWRLSIAVFLFNITTPKQQYGMTTTVWHDNTITCRYLCRHNFPVLLLHMSGACRLGCKKIHFHFLQTQLCFLCFFLVCHKTSPNISLECIRRDSQFWRSEIGCINGEKMVMIFNFEPVFGGCVGVWVEVWAGALGVKSC